ncbi:unnamed protein product [Phaeothamnion confervicola]
MEEGKLPGVTAAARVTLEWYDDLSAKISRSEVVEIAERARQDVDAAAARVDPTAEVRFTVVGGYRRGNPSSHDVDVLVTLARCEGDAAPQPDYVEFRHAIEEELGRSGLLRHVFLSGAFSVQASDQDSPFEKQEIVGEQRRFALVPGFTGHMRRLDVVVVKPEQYAFGMLSWSGDTLFQRSIREYAEHERKWKFSQNGLVDLEHQQPVPAIVEGKLTTEEAIFKELGLKYIPPEFRFC